MYGYGSPRSARPMSAYQRSPRIGFQAPGVPQAVAAAMPPPPQAYSPRLSPRSFRPTSAPLRPTSAAVRAGGRLYVQSPLTGMSENEMINEARLRLQHNKQRLRLKNVLQASADGGSVVGTRDLLLACKLAKLDVGTDNPYEVDQFVQPEHIARRDCYGSPRSVNWRQFQKSIPYPELHPPGCYPGELPLTKFQKAQIKEYEEMQAKLRAQGEADAAAAAAKVEVARDEDVRYYHKILKRMLETRFSELRRAFRLIDEDRSGSCDREELKHMLTAMFNIEIPEKVFDRIIDLADYDGDGQIDFAEFARLATEDDVLNMKKTLQADVGNWGREDLEAKLLEIDKQKMAEQKRAAAQGGYADQGYHPKLRRTGPSLDELRRAHKTIKKAVLARYPDFPTAFKSIDKDGSGTLRRAELRRFLAEMVKTVGDRIISGLIDFCDDDGDGKTLSKQEFCKLMSAEYLGAGGFDPNSGKRYGKGTRP